MKRPTFYLHRSGEMVYRLWRGQIHFKYITWPKSQPWAESSMTQFSEHAGFTQITREKVNSFWPKKNAN